MTSEDEEFSRFFDAHFPRLQRFLDGLLGRGRGLAEEVAQESFMRLYHAGLDSLPREEARFWLFRVARNLALNELEKGRTRRRLLDRIVGTFSTQTTADPERVYEATEQGRVVFEMLKSLPEPQRAALLLREQEGMSYREIAAVLGVSEGKVKVDVFRARNALRAGWEKAQGRAAGVAG
jgi:RNA polymerase sigma-70 factor (ECF subfamily)